MAKEREKNGEPDAPEQGEPACPKYLDKYARECWKEIIHELRGRGDLSKDYRLKLAACCEWYSLFRRRMESLKKLENPQDVMKARRLQASCSEAYHHYVDALSHWGLTPATRSKVQVQEKRDGERNGKERFFGAG